jgi:CRISPR-associated endonuclease/helicase Cas3
LKTSSERALEEIQAKVQGDCYRLEFLIRMAFSTLVDADYLDTEAHFSPETARLRQRTYRLEELWNAFQRDQEALLQGASPSPVNEVRREVYQACLQAAELPSGPFPAYRPYRRGQDPERPGLRPQTRAVYTASSG